MIIKINKTLVISFVVAVIAFSSGHYVANYNNYENFEKAYIEGATVSTINRSSRLLLELRDGKSHDKIIQSEIENLCNTIRDLRVKLRYEDFAMNHPEDYLLTIMDIEKECILIELDKE